MDSATLTVEIRGGLGNQMFLGVFGRLAAEATSRVLRFDTSFFGRVGPDREYELDHLSGFWDVPQTQTSFSGLPRYQDGLTRRLRLPSPGLYRESGFNYSGPSFDQYWRSQIVPARRVKGYFQSWRYFEGRFSEVREWVQPITPSQAIAEVEAEVGARYLAVHVRRGDYLTSEVSSAFGLCSDDYYLSAIRILQRLAGEHLPIVLVTDTAASISTELRNAVTLVQGPGSGISAIDQLQVLVKATQLVMSNSSYSWWGAFLGEREVGSVVAPRPWFKKGDLAGHELLLPEWLSLGSQ